MVVLSFFIDKTRLQSTSLIISRIVELHSKEQEQIDSGWGLIDFIHRSGTRVNSAFLTTPVSPPFLLKC